MLALIAPHPPPARAQGRDSFFGFTVASMASGTLNQEEHRKCHANSPKLWFFFRFPGECEARTSIIN